MLLQFYGACLNRERPFLVLEFMEGGDLREALSDPNTARHLDWSRSALLLSQHMRYRSRPLRCNKEVIIIIMNI